MASAATNPRQQAHELIDRMAASQVYAVVGLLETMLDPVSRAIANKFLPCTASMFATAVGFAALAVSEIRPVREMGLWTACGLIVAWVGCFTGFLPFLLTLDTYSRSLARVNPT